MFTNLRIIFFFAKILHLCLKMRFKITKGRIIAFITVKVIISSHVSTYIVRFGSNVCILLTHSYNSKNRTLSAISSPTYISYASKFLVFGVIRLNIFFFLILVIFILLKNIIIYRSA